MRLRLQQAFDGLGNIVVIDQADDGPDFFAVAGEEHAGGEAQDRRRIFPRWRRCRAGSDSSSATFWPPTSKRSFSRKGWIAFLPSSSMETPRMVKPRGLYFCWNSIIQGISTLQGSHQVAQKFTRTTSPLYCARVTSLSLRSFRVTVGASVGLAGALAARRAGRREFVVGPDHDGKQRNHARGNENALFHVANFFLRASRHESPHPLQRKLVQKSQFTR